jgi:[ribosomal protein S18]-alanine N-acetyltransferase
LNATPEFAAGLRPMTLDDVDEVLNVERAAYEFPWTRGNFTDSLSAGHDAEVLRDRMQCLLGYFVAMPGVDEIHLLNLTVAPQVQARGHGRFLLERVIDVARRRGLNQVWLEVRRQNERAQRIYTRFGFATSGVRKGYYPAPLGRREDAIVMNLTVAPLSRTLR